MFDIEGVHAEVGKINQGIENKLVLVEVPEVELNIFLQRYRQARVVAVERGKQNALLQNKNCELQRANELAEEARRKAEEAKRSIEREVMALAHSAVTTRKRLKRYNYGLAAALIVTVLQSVDAQTGHSVLAAAHHAAAVLSTLMAR